MAVPHRQHVFYNSIAVLGNSVVYIYTLVGASPLLCQSPTLCIGLLSNKSWTAVTFTETQVGLCDIIDIVGNNSGTNF